MDKSKGLADKDDIKKDLKEWLLNFVKCQSDDEKMFSEELKTCQLKFYLRLHHEPANDRLIIHTKLKQIQSTERSTCCESNSPELHNTDFFYIKSQCLNHTSGENILDGHFTGILMSIETIVTRGYSKFEVVFKTTITQNSFEKNYDERSFVREKLKGRSTLADDVFSPSPTSDNVNITNLLNDDVGTNEVSKDKKKKMKKKKNKLGENIMKILEIKDLRKAFTDVFSKPSTMNKNVPKLSVSSNPVKRKSIQEFIRMFSMDAIEQDDEKPTNIYLTASLQKQTHKLELLKDNINFIDEDEDEDEKLSPLSVSPISVTDLCCTFSFKMTSETSEKKESEAQSTGHCDCEDRRIKMSVTGLGLIRIKKDKDKQNLIDYLKTFDKIKRHFPDCIHDMAASRNTIVSVSSDDLSSILHISDEGSLPRHGRSRSVSMASEFIHEILQDIRIDNKIIITHDHIKYFQEAKTYKEYESGFINALSQNLSPENLSLCFVLTRTIIMQIDDPNYENNNTDIKRILKYSLRYLIKTYSEEIAKEWGSLEDYLLKYEDLD